MSTTFDFIDSIAVVSSPVVIESDRKLSGCYHGPAQNVIDSNGDGVGVVAVNETAASADTLRCEIQNRFQNISTTAKKIIEDVKVPFRFSINEILGIDASGSTLDCSGDEHNNTPIEDRLVTAIRTMQGQRFPDNIESTYRKHTEADVVASLTPTDVGYVVGHTANTGRKVVDRSRPRVDVDERATMKTAQSTVLQLPSRLMDNPGLSTTPTVELFQKCRLRRHRSDRKPRQPFTVGQLDTLEIAFSQQPYLSISERSDVAASLGIDEQRVKIWFQNRRAKSRRIAEAHIDERNRTRLIIAAAAAATATVAVGKSNYVVNESSRTSVIPCDERKTLIESNVNFRMQTMAMKTSILENVGSYWPPIQERSIPLQAIRGSNLPLMNSSEQRLQDICADDIYQYKYIHYYGCGLP